MTRRLRRWTLLPLLGICACSIPTTIEQLDAASPPPKLGRPIYVRALAGLGAWVGGTVGGVASIALLPVTWPIRALSGDRLGDHSGGEWMFFPATCLAGMGHAALGAPVDVLDYALRRAWVADDDVVMQTLEEPLAAPAMPTAAGSAAAATADQNQAGG